MPLLQNWLRPLPPPLPSVMFRPSSAFIKYPQPSSELTYVIPPLLWSVSIEKVSYVLALTQVSPASKTSCRSTFNKSLVKAIVPEASGKVQVLIAVILLGDKPAL